MARSSTCRLLPIFNSISTIPPAFAAWLGCIYGNRELYRNKGCIDENRVFWGGLIPSIDHARINQFVLNLMSYGIK